MEGWIKLYRKIITWRWYKDGKTLQVFLHLLLQATRQDITIGGVSVQRGQLLTSLAEIAEGTGLSCRSVRTALEHLRSTNELTSKTTNRFTIITLCNYEDYQLSGRCNRQTDRQTDRQTEPDLPYIDNKKNKEVIERKREKKIVQKKIIKNDLDDGYKTKS